MQRFYKAAHKTPSESSHLIFLAKATENDASCYKLIQLLVPFTLVKYRCSIIVISFPLGSDIRQFIFNILPKIILVKTLKKAFKCFHL